MIKATELKRLLTILWALRSRTPQI